MSSPGIGEPILGLPGLPRFMVRKGCLYLARLPGDEVAWTDRRYATVFHVREFALGDARRYDGMLVRIKPLVPKVEKSLFDGLQQEHEELQSEFVAMQKELVTRRRADAYERFHVVRWLVEEADRWLRLEPRGRDGSPGRDTLMELAGAIAAKVHMPKEGT